jgi:phenylpyruvate tautomerase PptA (4-oxalocrotonate tautomerase family)
MESMLYKHKKAAQDVAAPKCSIAMDEMARYLVQIPKDSLSETRKAEIAKTISEVHSAVMNSGADTIQIAITEIDAGCFFAGGRLIECDHIFVHGFLPDGERTRELKSSLSARLATDVTRIANFEPDSTWVSITETLETE